tara:strand:+ start:193 stop:402 length:210 start_codon:yes stop_codon:yes gene_type:complete
MDHWALQRQTKKMAIELRMWRFALIKEFCTCRSLNCVGSFIRVVEDILELKKIKWFPVKGVNTSRLKTT